MPSGGTATAAFLFCDMVGSTDLLTRLGDDAGDRVRRDIYGSLRRALAVTRGVEVKSTGDGLMVAFPNSVADAVACAVAMQRGVARLDRANPLLGIGLRVGVAVGEAVQEDDDWYGTPVVEAARLCAAARPGQILASDLVPALVGSRGTHRFTGLGVMPLKGLDDVAVSEIDWEPDAAPSLLPLPSALDAAVTTPMVDRWRERDAVLAAWRAAATGAGSGRAVLVTGEAGAGRTRLVAEVARAVHAEGGTVLYGRCHEDLAVPYEPFAEAIGWYAGVCPAEDLRVRLGASGGELGRIVPGLALRVPDLAAPVAAGTEVGRDRLFEAVAWFLGAVADAGPTLLVLDDLHLATPPTIALLERVLGDTGGRRLLVLATAREDPDGDEGARLLARLRRQHALEHLALGGIDAAAVAELVTAITGRPTDAAAAEALRAETDGNPGLVTRLAVEAGEGGVATLPCPYKGLSPFQPEDAELFFGREDVVDGLLSRLANARVLALVGPSGSGKSSVLRAGVLPAIWRGALAGSSSWRVAVVSPGVHPLAELAAAVALLDHRSPAQLLADLETDPRALDLAVRQVLVGANPAARVVLVVDQLEELFTICGSDRERGRFVEAVVHAATVPGGRMVLVTSMRADFYGHVASHPDLAAAVESNHVLLGPLRAHELRSAVERPARAIGMLLEAGLADLVVADADDQPGALPLVSHALAQTWKHRRGRTLTVAGYRAAGGVRGALAATAEEVWASLDAEEQVVARRVLLRLVEVGDSTEDTSRRVERDELVGIAPRAAAVLDRLTDARLLLAGGSTVEVGHEALIRAWPRLCAWLDEDRSSLQVLGHLREAAKAWERSGHDESELYRGARLAAVLEVVGGGEAALDPLAREFLDACGAREEAELRAAEARVHEERRVNRLLRGLLAAAAALLLAALVAGLLAVDQRSDARAAERLADARRVGTAAQVDRELERALLLAVAGWRLDDTAETRGNLLAALARSPRVAGVARTDGGRLLTLDRSPDGRRLLATDHRGSLHLLDTATHRWLDVGEPEGFTPGARFSHDGRSVLATTGGDPGETSAVAELDAETLEPTGVRYVVPDDVLGPEAPDGFLLDVAIDPSGRYVVGAIDRFPGSPDILVWERSRSESPPRVLRPDGPGIWAIEFTAGGARLEATTESAATAWSTASWEEVPTVGGQGARATSPDGSLVATVAEGQGPDGGEVAVLDAATGEVVARLVGHRDQVNDIAFDSTGSRIATASDDQTVAVWDASTGEELLSLEGHTGRITGVSFGPDDATVYSVALDRSLVAWDLLADRTLSELVHGPASFEFSDLAFPIGDDGSWLFVTEQSTLVRRDADGTESEPVPVPEGTFFLDVSADGRFVGTIAGDGEVTLLDATSLERLGTASTVEGVANAGAIAFARDGDSLVVGADDGTVLELRTPDLEPTGRQVRTRPGIFGVRRAGPSTVVALLDDDEDLGSFTVGVVDLDGEEVGSVEAGLDPSTAAVDASGRYVALGGRDGQVAIVDLRSMALVGRPQLGHDGPVSRVTFSPDARTVVSGAFDGRIALWDVATGQLLASYLPAAPNAFVFPDFEGEDTILTASGDGTTTRFPAAVDAWAAHACEVAGRDLTEEEWAEAFGDRPFRSTCPPGD